MSEKELCPHCGKPLMTVRGLTARTARCVPCRYFTTLEIYKGNGTARQRQQIAERFGQMVTKQFRERSSGFKTNSSNESDKENS